MAKSETGSDALNAERVRAPSSPDAQIAFAYGKGWTDGLPVVPPTPDRVLAMLGGTKRAPGEVAGLVPPRWGEATVEIVAANAVMAGCAPAYLPVVLAALEACLEKPFNLYGTQATTHAVAPLIVVNGPIIDEIGLNYGYNLFGGGWRPNATIGRALNLVLRNVGGAHPGGLDRSTAGQPGKFTFCIAENEAESPWPPLHVERGFERGTSAVTVHGAGGILDINDRSSQRAEDLMKMLAGSMRFAGSNSYLVGGEPLLVLCPEHVALLKNDGVSKEALRAYLWEHAHMPADAFPESYFRDDLEPIAPGSDRYPICRDPERIIIVVGGGAGRHSMYVPTFGATLSVTRAIGE